MERLFSESELQPAIDFLENEINYHESILKRRQDFLYNENNYQSMDVIVAGLIHTAALIHIYKQAIKKLKADVQWEIQTEVFR